MNFADKLRDPIARILFRTPRQRLAIQQQAVAVALHEIDPGYGVPRAARIRDDEADAYRDQNAASAALYMALVAIVAVVVAGAGWFGQWWLA